MPKQVVAVVMYAGKDPVEADRILTGLREFREQDLEVIASDGGSAPEFVEAAQDLGVKVLKRPEQYFGTGVRQSLAAAAKEVGDNGVIIRTEGDKGGTYGFQSQLQGCLEHFHGSGADMTVLTRTPGSIATYPEVQRFGERELMNRPYSHILSLFGQSVSDFAYGPVIMKGSAVQHYLRSGYPGYVALFDPLIKAAEAGLKIDETPVKMEFIMKEEQAGKAALIKSIALRLDQAYEIFDPVMKFWRRRDPVRLLNHVFPTMRMKFEQFQDLASDLIAQCETP